MADPQVSETWYGGDWDTAAWFSSQFLEGGPTPFSFARNCCGRTGLQVGSYAYATYYDSAGQWTWGTYPDSYIARADFSGLEHNDAGSSLYTGIYSPGRGDFESLIDDYGNFNGYARTHYTSDDNNVATFGLRMLGSYERYDYGFVNMSGVTLYLGDRHPPTVESSEHSYDISQWTNAATASVRLRAHDDGLGLSAVGVARVNLVGDSYWLGLHTPPCTGSRQGRCATDFDTASDANFPTGRMEYRLDTLPEGLTEVHASAHEISGGQYGNPAFGPTWTAKIDRTPPTVTPSGELYDLRDQYINGQGPRNLTLSAHDPLSGVARLALQDDDGILAQTDVNCTPDQCPADATETLTIDTGQFAEGSHHLRVVATDLAGNADSSDAWTVIVDRTPPTFADDFLVTANIDPQTSTAIVDWDAAADHTLDDGSAPSGPGGGYRFRYHRPGASFSPWQDTDLERAEIPNSADGDTFVLEVVPLDDSGNAGQTRSASVTVSGNGSHCQSTANGAPSDCFENATFAPDAEENLDEPEVGFDDSGAAASAFGARRTRLVVNPPGQWATIRRYANSYVVGNASGKLGAGWQMDVAMRDYGALGWVTGKIYGGYQSCGWVRSGRVPSSNQVVDTGCSPTFRPTPEQFADGLNCQADATNDPSIKECKRGTPIELMKKVTDVDECLNVGPPPIAHYPTTCENKVPDRLTAQKIQAGYTVSWRYTTNGRALPGGSRFVLVFDHHIDNPRFGRWAFIPRRAFRSHLCTRNAIRKYACGDPL